VVSSEEAMSSILIVITFPIVCVVDELEVAYAQVTGRKIMPWHKPPEEG
jgi:hypothetical protein